MYDYKSKIEKGFQYLGIRVIRYRLAIMLMTVVVAGLAATQLPKLSIATSVESMFKWGLGSGQGIILIFINIHPRNRCFQTQYRRFRAQNGPNKKLVALEADIPARPRRPFDL